MALFDQMKSMKDLAAKNQDHREISRKLIQIYEGEMIPHLENTLRGVFMPKTYEELRKFFVPINTLPKIVDKLTKIYQQNPTRTVDGGTESDKSIVDWYEKQLNVNQMFNVGNEYFNLLKGVLIEPYLDKQRPQLRIIPSDRYFVFSDDPINPMRATHVTVILDRRISITSNQPVNIYLTYTDDEFLIWDDELEIYPTMMSAYGNDGVNHFGRIPYTYVKKSVTKLMPTIDSDTLEMTLQLPAQLTFLNFAIGYNCFPINYVIDASVQDLERAPNAIWSLKSDKTSEHTPQIGSVKPVIDIDSSMNFIQSCFSMWLNTKGIRPGSVGHLSPDQFATGISKMIDESDTTDSRKKQVEYFINGEAEFWDLLLNHVHPYWCDNGLIENRAKFSATAKVVTNFSEQQVAFTRSEIVRDIKDELSLGLESKIGAMRRLNPHMSDEQIIEKLAEIDSEKQPVEKPAVEEEAEVEDEAEDKKEETEEKEEENDSSEVA